MSFEALDHVGFVVSNMERSVAWYTMFLGSPPTVRDIWDREYIGRLVGYPDCRMECAYWSLPGGAKLELIEYLEPPTRGIELEPRTLGNGHLCLLTEDVHAEFRRLAGQGVEFRQAEPIEIPWGPYKGGWSCYALDPDQLLIQLTQPPPDGVRV